MNSLLTVSGFISAIIIHRFIPHEKSRVFYQAFAYLFLLLAVVIMSAYFLRFFAGPAWPFIVPGISDIIRMGDTLWFFLLGYGFVAIVSNIRTPLKDWQKTFDWIKWGAVIRIAGFFLFVTLGKYRHLDEMITFFTASGYSESFLYIILILECLGALGIILDFYFRTGIIATVGLMVLMAGAIITHLRNGDPLSDSYDAFAQMTGLIFLAMLFYSRKVVNRKLT
jgi:hypothetical protein